MELSVKNFVSALVEKVGVLFTFLFVAFPIVWIALTAFKNPTDTYSKKIFFTPTLDNFIDIMGPNYNIGALFMNSMIIALATVAIAIPLALMAAYVLSRYPFPGNKILLVYILTTQFIPPVVIVLPFFSIFRSLHLIDTKLALIIVNLSVAIPYAIWLLKGFIDSLPVEIEEAAMVDGCNQFHILRRIVLPLVAPGAITTAVFVFVLAWNEFLYAMILTRSAASKTMTIGLMSAIGIKGVEWEHMAAIGLMIMIPIFLLSFLIRKHFVQGLTSGGVK